MISLRIYRHAVASHTKVRAGKPLVAYGRGRNNAKHVHWQSNVLQIGVSRTPPSRSAPEKFLQPWLCPSIRTGQRCRSVFHKP